MILRIGSIAFALPLIALFGCSEPRQDSGSGEQVTSTGPADAEPGIDDVVAVDEFPSVTKQVRPVYPEDAMKAGIEGTVWVKALVNKDGNVAKAIVTKTTGGSPSLEQAALDAVKQFTFTPARIKNKPVQMWISFPFKFKLAPKKS